MQRATSLLGVFVSFFFVFSLFWVWVWFGLLLIFVVFFFSRNTLMLIVVTKPICLTLSRLHLGTNICDF